MGRIVATVHKSECLPVTVIFISVVTSKRGKKSETNCIGEENLSTCIHPYLKKSIKACLFLRHWLWKQDPISMYQAFLFFTCGSERRDIFG